MKPNRAMTAAKKALWEHDGPNTKHSLDGPFGCFLCAAERRKAGEVATLEAINRKSVVRSEEK